MSDAFQDYLFEYRHDGGTWGLKIRARSPEDAQARLKALAWARYRGEVGATIQVPSVFGRLVAKLLNR